MKGKKQKSDASNSICCNFNNGKNKQEADGNVSTLAVSQHGKSHPREKLILDCKKSKFKELNKL